ncbi:MAG TPA: aspartyl protease family protein [Terracidiphilus sp.]|nr:aspartyl protease family protein [Terracidiphilus sp.]
MTRVAFVLAGVMVLGGLTISLRAQEEQDLRQMLDANQAFALRDTVAANGHAPVFYRGAVEDSLNRVQEAQRDLEKAMATDPLHAFEAHEMLANENFRNGRYREGLAELEAAHKSRPDAADVKNFLPLMRALAAWPDMEVVDCRGSRVKMQEESKHTQWLPVKIDGHDVIYGFDSGAALSTMGEADAKQLGLEVRHVDMQLNEASGKDVQGVDLAMVHDLVIGGLHLRNVPFFVLQDSGEPFAKMAVGTRGLLGLPVMLAMQSVRWDSEGWFTLGSNAHVRHPSAQNLLFHGTTAIVEVAVNGRALIFSLDTGAVDTDLNAGFAKALPELVARGKKETRAITGMGGSENYDSVLLGPVTFSVGGHDVVVLAPHVFPSHSLGSFDGNMGHDILDQAKSVTIDFKSMALELQ